MSPLEIEIDWSRAQIAHARQAAWRAVAGYHWTEGFGRASWLGQGVLFLLTLALLAPHLVSLVRHGQHLDATAILAGFCVLGLAYFPGHLVSWIRSGGLGHWPTRNMVDGFDCGPASVRMDGNGIAWSRALIDQSLAWRAVTTIAEDRDFFVLASGDALALMLPKTPSIRDLLEAVTDGAAGTDAIYAVR